MKDIIHTSIHSVMQWSEYGRTIHRVVMIIEMDCEEIEKETIPFESDCKREKSKEIIDEIQ